MGFRLFDLNPEQQEAVRTIDGPLLILAGAGTGKTRVITSRVAYLIAQGIPPEAILAVTFTNKAAKEMRERLAGMIEKSDAKQVVMSTFHALCVRLLRGDIDRLGYKRNFTIYDEGDQMGLIRKIITKVSARDEKLDPHAAKSMISRLKNQGLRERSPGDDQSLMAAVYLRYQEELKTLNAVDFDDLLILAVQLLRENGDVREKWQSRFSHIMIDEFQDTNRLQLELVTLLADERRNVAVVGDDDQSIYGWRGADVTNILEFESHFPGPVVVKLEENYRSTRPILETANAVIRNNAMRRAKRLRTSRDQGDPVRLIQMLDDRAEAEFIAGEIHLRQATEHLHWEDFAVLFRTNQQSRLIEQQLRQLKVPYRVVGGKSFFDRREIKDLLAYASVLLNTDDDVSLLRIINTPPRGIGEGTIEAATEASAKAGCSIWKIIQDHDFLSGLSQRARSALGSFVEMMDQAESRMLEPLADQPKVLAEWVESVGYYEEIKRSCKTMEEAQGRETNVRELISGFTQEFEKKDRKGAYGLREFLDDMMLRQEADDEEDEDRGGVTLITMHAAKGLEYPSVYLIGFEEGVLPHSRSKLEGTIDEERRLLYVGITRAMRSLTITWCDSRIKYGSPSPCTLSSFAKEFPPEHVVETSKMAIDNAPVTKEEQKGRFDALIAALNAM
jgi:superfamily I DNA/RNA helicase